tara:strand:+ start:433 stop:822 length:390 start_codon:yes stop_codon:yes gene_type:complete
MKKQLEQLKEFNQAFKIEDAKKPRLINKEESDLRWRLMDEENLEYLEACEQKDIVEVADALADQLYILCGTILKHGMGNIIEDLFNEVHRSNMSKLDENGNRIVREDGKILKSSLYTPPNLNTIIKANK